MENGVVAKDWQITTVDVERLNNPIKEAQSHLNHLKLLLLQLILLPVSDFTSYLITFIYFFSFLHNYSKLLF